MIDQISMSKTKGQWEQKQSVSPTEPHSLLRKSSLHNKYCEYLSTVGGLAVATFFAIYGTWHISQLRHSKKGNVKYCLQTWKCWADEDSNQTRWDWRQTFQLPLQNGAQLLQVHLSHAAWYLSIHLQSVNHKILSHNVAQPMFAV